MLWSEFVRDRRGFTAEVGSCCESRRWGRAARLRLPRILLRRARLRCRVAFTGGGVAAEPGARGGTEPTTCCLGIGVAPMRSALVRGKLWQVVYSSKTVCSCNTARSPFPVRAQGTPRQSVFRPVFLRGSDQTAKHITPILRLTLMNAGIPVWGANKGDVRPGIAPVTGRFDYDEAHSPRLRFALDGSFPLGCIP